MIWVCFDGLVAGHQFTNIISRELDVEIYNEGFSASGTMEISVAEHLVAIKKPAAVYIIDCVWNMNPVEIAQRTEPLVKYLLANGTKGAASKFTSNLPLLAEALYVLSTDKLLVPFSRVG